MLIRLLHGHYIGSRPGVSDTWRAGDADRELSLETANYLLGTFPGKFETVAQDAFVPPESLAEVVEAPEVDRAMKSPKGRGKGRP